MATEEAIAIKRQAATRRLDAALKSLTAKRGLSYDRLPTHHKEGATLLGLAQIEHVATVAEQLVGYETLNPPEVEVVDAIGSISVPEDTAYSLSGLVEILVQDAGLEWATVDFTAESPTDPLTHIKDQLVSAMRAKGLIPETEGEVTMKYVDEDGNPTDANGNRLPVDPNPNDGDRDTEDADPEATESADGVSSVLGNEGAVRESSRAAVEKAITPASKKPAAPRAKKGE